MPSSMTGWSGQGYGVFRASMLASHLPERIGRDGSANLCRLNGPVAAR
jgi:hypothetical protein